MLRFTLLAVGIAASVALAGCARTAFTASGHRYPSYPQDCSFQLLTSSPPAGYAEIGVVDVQAGYVDEIDTFKTRIQSDVCKAGGDLAIAHANGVGNYIKATVFRRVNSVPAEIPTASSEPELNSSSGCTYDTQCKGDRICEAGQCVSPGDLQESPNSTVIQ